MLFELVGGGNALHAARPHPHALFSRLAPASARGSSPPLRRGSWGYIRLATSSSITSVAPPPIDCTRASRAMRSIADSRI